MTEVNSFNIERNGRMYHVSVIYDEGAESPRNNDHSATQFYVVQPRFARGPEIYVDELDSDAGSALKHFIDRYGIKRGIAFDRVERAFHIWTVIAKSPVVLVTGEGTGYAQSDWHYWYALVDRDVLQRDQYNASAEELAKTEADEYNAWAFGDVFGVVVSLGGEEVGALWGVIDSKGDYVQSVAEDIVDEHELKLQSQASKVGAGFVGVI